MCENSQVSRFRLCFSIFFPSSFPLQFKNNHYRASRHFPSNFDIEINKGTCLVVVEAAYSFFFASFYYFEHNIHARVSCVCVPTSVVNHKLEQSRDAASSERNTCRKKGKERHKHVLHLLQSKVHDQNFISYTLSLFS